MPLIPVSPERTTYRKKAREHWCGSTPTCVTQSTRTRELLRKGAAMSEGDYLVEISASAVVNDDERERTLTVSVQDGAVSVRIRTDDEQKQHIVNHRPMCTTGLRLMCTTIS
jgi:hypothetical protein